MYINHICIIRAEPVILRSLTCNKEKIGTNIKLCRTLHLILSEKTSHLLKNVDSVQMKFLHQFNTDP